MPARSRSLFEQPETSGEKPEATRTQNSELVPAAVGPSPAFLSVARSPAAREGSGSSGQRLGRSRIASKELRLRSVSSVSSVSSSLPWPSVWDRSDSKVSVTALGTTEAGACSRAPPSKGSDRLAPSPRLLQGQLQHLLALQRPGPELVQPLPLIAQ